MTTVGPNRKWARVAAPLMIVLAAAAAGGCGVSDGARSPKEKVKSVSQAYLRAIAAKDAAGVCALVSKAESKRMAADAGSCEKKIGEQKIDAGTRAKLEQSADNAKVSAVKIHGNQADLTFVSASGPLLTIKLGFEDGSWKVDGVTQ